MKLGMVLGIGFLLGLASLAFQQQNFPGVSLTANVSIVSGAGVPAAGTCVAANGGSIWLRTDSDATHTLYVCDNSTHTWTAK